MKYTKAFTLTEILVSITIFTVLSVAMLGIFSTSTRLYKNGEVGRKTNDSAIAITSRINRDFEKMSGDVFYMDVNNTDGNCGIGWTITKNKKQIFVFWDCTDKGLFRREFDMKTFRENYKDNYDINDILNKIDNTESISIAKNCLHFSAWLTGVTKNNVYYPVPDKDTCWYKTKEDKADVNGETIPNTNEEYSTIESNDSFPSAIKFTFILPISNKTGKLKNIDGNYIQIRGIQGIPSKKNSVIKIGNEWISYKKFNGKRLIINQSKEDGYTGEDGKTGRAILRSVKATHKSGATAQIGKVFTFVKSIQN